MILPSHVGRYAVRDEIARGGFALVVRAWDEELESFVAIKILYQDLARNEDIQNRFLEEARLLRRIRSSNIVTVHDVGRLNDGCPYFVMDFADRGTLAERLDRFSNARDPQGITFLVDALSDGLSALHEAGVVHRDVKPANVLFQLARRMPEERSVDKATTNLPSTSPNLVDTNERILLGDLGIAKDLVGSARMATIVAGTPLYQAPEQEDVDAAITPSADIYAATAVLWQVMTSSKPPRPGEVDREIDELPLPWHDFFKQGMAFDPQRRFNDIYAWQSAVYQAVSQQTHQAAFERPTGLTPASAPCPYKGLAAYQPEDARFFFGREFLIDELVRRIQSNRVMVVAGPSGSGKSSLVRAGFIPALQAGALPHSNSWRLALFTPGRDPMAELYLQLKSFAPDDRTPISIDDLLAHPGMARYLGVDQQQGQESPLLLCVDQFEELFTLAPEGQVAQFITALSAMTDPAHSNVRIVIVIRADFYGACAQIPWLAERITDNQVLVGPMSRAELRRAITDPARRAGLSLENELADAIIDEAGSETGSLPLVAHALVETWARRRGNILTLEGFRQAGGVVGAISQTAESTYENRFDAVEREATMRLFLRLVTPGESKPDTRRILGRSEIDNDPHPEVMHKVIECMTEVRLLTLDDTTVQIAHEALIRIWPRLRTWIEQSRDDLRTRQRISYAAAEWNAENQDPDLLYRGTHLLSALEWSDRNSDQLGTLEREFLHESAETKAKAEAAVAEIERRARNKRRLAMIVLSFLSIGATAASVVAFLAFQKAQQNEQTAALATIEAHEKFAGALGAVAHGLVGQDPLLALVLGAEATQRREVNPPSFEARAAMLRARQELAMSDVHVLGSPIAVGDAITIALSPDGSLLATGHLDGTIDLIDTATKQPQRPSLYGHVGGIRDLEFGPRGRRLLSAGSDGSVRLWSVDEGLGNQSKILGKTDDVVMGICFHPDGTQAAAAGGDGTVRLWNTENASSSGEVLASEVYEFNNVEFSPNGRDLVAGYSDGTIFGWNLATRKMLFDPIRGAHTSNFRSIVMGPNHDSFATVSTDGTSKLFHYPSGRVLDRPFDGEDSIGAIEFTQDGAYLIGGTNDGTLKLWDIERNKTAMTTTSGHSKSIIDAKTNSSHTVLATLGRDQSVRMWSLGVKTPLARRHHVTGRAAKGLAFSPDGDRLAVGDDAGVVQIWDLVSGRQPLELSGHDQQVWAVAFSPEGDVLASADRHGQLILWDALDGNQIWSVQAHDTPVWSIAFAKSSEQLVTAGETALGIWDAKTGKRIRDLPGGSGRITRMALSPDESFLVTAATDGLTRIWDLDGGTVTRIIAADDNLIWSVAISPDNRQLATASSDEVVILWNLQTGQQQAVYAGHTGGATDVAYLSDGVTLLVTDRTGKLHFWDILTDRRLSEAWQGHGNASWRIALHPDGTHFATSGDDGQINVWDVFSVERACDIGASALDSVRRHQYLGETEQSVACD